MRQCRVSQIDTPKSDTCLYTLAFTGGRSVCFHGSASSLQDFRVQALQFAAGVCYGHVPVHTTLGLVQVL